MWTRINQPFTLPLEVRDVLTKLYAEGFDAYLVGGSVRDWLRGDPIKDYDVATSATPSEVERVFDKVIDVGRTFGVMKVVVSTGEGQAPREIEVTTFRKESGYQDHRHPSKVEFSNVMEDASRRDFTVNALYYDIKTGQVLDAFGGLNDLKLKVMKAIGNPDERFQEDSLRLLRAVRFAARFGFTIEEETAKSIGRNASLIQKVSIERIRDEVEKMLSGPEPRKAIELLHQLRLFEYIFPEVSVAILSKKKILEQTLGMFDHLKSGVVLENKVFYWGLVYLPALRQLPIDQRASRAQQIAERLKFSKEQQHLFIYLVQETAKFREVFSMRQATLYRWMKHEYFESLLRFHQLDAISSDGNQAGLEFVNRIYPEAKKKFESKPLLTGDDLVKLGMQPGRKFTEILTAIEDLSMEGKFQTKEEALEYVLQTFI